MLYFLQCIDQCSHAIEFINLGIQGTTLTSALYMHLLVVWAPFYDSFETEMHVKNYIVT